MHEASSGAHAKHVTATKPAVSYVNRVRKLAIITYRCDLVPKVFYVMASEINTAQPGSMPEHPQQQDPS